MEITIRVMMGVVVGLIAVLLIIMLMFGLGGDANNALTDFFNNILGMKPR